MVGSRSCARGLWCSCLPYCLRRTTPRCPWPGDQGSGADGSRLRSFSSMLSSGGGRAAGGTATADSLAGTTSGFLRRSRRRSVSSGRCRPEVRRHRRERFGTAIPINAPWNSPSAAQEIEQKIEHPEIKDRTEIEQGDRTIEPNRTEPNRTRGYVYRSFASLRISPPPPLFDGGSGTIFKLRRRRAGRRPRRWTQDISQRRTPVTAREVHSGRGGHGRLRTSMPNCGDGHVNQLESSSAATYAAGRGGLLASEPIPEVAEGAAAAAVPMQKAGDGLAHRGRATAEGYRA